MALIRMISTPHKLDLNLKGDVMSSVGMNLVISDPFSLYQARVGRAVALQVNTTGPPGQKIPFRGAGTDVSDTEDRVYNM